MAKVDLKKSISFDDIKNAIKKKFTGQSDDEVLSGQTGKYEVNLVPEIKLKMIRTLKIRNLLFFGCIVVSSVCVGIVLVLFGVKTGQDITMAVQDGHTQKLEDKLVNYKELPEFLTIQEQLQKIAAVEDNKKVLSRVFSILDTLLPSGKDVVTLSELDVDLENSTLSFDAQANAGEEPYIDYRVLESFKKSSTLMKYDYGRYVDADGRDIPTRCIKESDKNGKMYSEKGAIYAIWTRGVTGCDPGRDDYKVDDDGNVENKDFTSENVSSSLENTDYTGSSEGIGSLDKKKNDSSKSNDEEDEEDDEKETSKGKIVDIIPDEKIWRTPQFTAWNKGERVMTAEDGIDDEPESKDDEEEKSEDGDDGEVLKNVMSYVYTPSMSMSGEISGVPHFKSECITYSGEENDGKIKWSANNRCDMLNEDVDISDSSNGRDSDDNLVLMFKATLTLNENVFSYRNKHMMAISPSGQNVTDSYVQIDSMFAKKASDCAANDLACKDKKNATGVGEEEVEEE